MAELSRAKDGHVADRLKSDHIIWLGSIRPDGRPHLVPVWFDWDGEKLTVFSEPDNQKIANMRHDHRVILAHDDTHGGGDVVLFEGEATLTDERASDVISAAYVEKYGAQMETMGLNRDSMASQYSQVIRIEPTRFMGW